MMSSDLSLTRGSMVKVFFVMFKKLTPARTSPRNVYLNLFGGAHFQVENCNIAKKTCLSLNSYISMKLLFSTTLVKKVRSTTSTKEVN